MYLLKNKINTKSVWRRVYLLSATFLLGLLVFSSCKKQYNTQGKDTLGSGDILGSITVDTFDLKTFTTSSDSIISSGRPYGLLGSYNDPDFGKFEAGFYTQLRLSGENPNFGDVSQIVVDSLVLGLEYAGYYGEIGPQNVEVYRLSDTLSKSTTYYSFTSKAVNSTDLVEAGKQTFIATPDKKTVIGTQTFDPQLRIFLDKSLATELLNEAASGGQNFTTNENFVNYFKGLYVKVNNGVQSSGKGAVYYFNLDDPQSKLTIYYKQAGLSKTFDFLINSNCAKFNKIDIDNSGKPVSQVLSNSALGQQEFYTQAFKTRAVVSIPGIKGLPKRSVIHRADLILPIQYQAGSRYTPANQLTVTTKIDGKLYDTGILGSYDPYFKYYKINLQGYIQAVVAGQKDITEFTLAPGYFVISADRVVFNGPATINKMTPKLVVTYTQH